MIRNTTISGNVLALLATLAVALPAAGWSHVPDSQTAVHGLTDVEVVAAIDLGRSTKDGFAFRGVTTVGRRDMGHLEYTLMAQGPFGRIVSAAATSARNHQVFTVGSVTKGMRAPLRVIEATPQRCESLGDSLQIVPPATLILLRRLRHDDPTDTASIEPIRVRTFPVSQSNSKGGRLRGQGVSTYFPLESVPADDFEIVVIAEDESTGLRLGSGIASG